ncbi:crotonase/enoyl-CoA hydratase family protein [Pontimonas sp.]|nr:crotonase/enoyl-CoA hydratase family protein [Pontimonas sp.]
MSDSHEPTVTVERVGHLLEIGLNRPDKRNAANVSMLEQLALAYGELDRNPELRVGLVHAHGDHFTAGLDLVDVGPSLQKTGSLPIPAGGVDPWGISTSPVSKPVVIALKGTCFTLGVELALASDVVIAQRNTVCAQLEVARGILPFGGASTRMPAAAGWANAMRWLLSAESFSAEEAYRLNIVTEIVEEDPLERAREVANTITQQAPLAVQETLASARAAQTDPHGEHTQLQHRLGRLMVTQDVARGMEAFMTKKPAVFEGN